MYNQVVKAIFMKKILLFQFLNIFAPNKCYFCGKIGDLVCAECQSNQEFRIQTVRRKSETRPTREFFLGDREGVLAKILDEAKFNGLAENFEVLAKILAESLKTCDEFSSLKDEIVIVPAPTSARHARQRGVAHSEFMAKILARELGVKVAEIVGIKSHFVQKGASAKVRKSQASKGYQLLEKPRTGKIYVVFDDIRTTGATIDAIAKNLREADADEVWALYLMRQKF